jgi:hypothetical protein
MKNKISIIGFGRTFQKLTKINMPKEADWKFRAENEYQ